MPSQRIPEEYIHYVWQYGLFRQDDLKTTNDESIELLSPGLHNHDAGPDFHTARLRIGEREWAGNIEIHFKSSDWDNHGHQLDRAYDSVILHVVIHHDKEILNSRGSVIPTLSLSRYLSVDHFRNYDHFVQSKSWIACKAHAKSVDPINWITLKERMALERMESKSQHVSALYEQKSKDWEEVTYQLLARSFGGKVNSEPFEHLSRLIPLQVIRKHSDNLALLDALFLGQAGFISKDFFPKNEYESRVLSDYQFMKHKYDLRAMDKVSWKTGRIRPSSAPQIRVTQFARIWGQSGSLHAFLMYAEAKAIKKRFSVTLEDYWSAHVGLQQPSKARKKSVGSSLLDRILINVVAPMRFAYGQQRDERYYTDSALSLLEDVAAEDNSIIRKWNDLGVEAAHALDTQGLLQLKHSRCDKKKCLNCTVGQAILR